MAAAKKRKKRSGPSAKAAGHRRHTVVYIHGIGNKPTADILKCQWDTALFGRPQGDRTRLAYWVDRERYPEPSDGTCASGDLVSDGGAGAEEGAQGKLAVRASRADWLAETVGQLALESGDPDRADALLAIGRALVPTHDDRVHGFSAKGIEAKVLPLPGPIRRFITRQLTRLFLKDVNDFLFDADVRAAMKQTLVDRLTPDGGPYVVVAHSQGSLIAWDALRELDAAHHAVDLWVTIGSPLGLAEVQDQLRRFAGVPKGKLPFPACVKQWLNVADRLDPVAADSNLGDDFAHGGRLRNVAAFGKNPDSPRNPHSGTGYLSTDDVRDAVRDVVGATFAQAVTDFVIARDLSDDVETLRRPERRRVLIGLRDLTDETATVDEARASIASAIEELTGDDHELAEVEPLRRYVAARLTRQELEALHARHRSLQIHRIWRDAAKRKLIDVSGATIQSTPAQRTYAATGRDIAWAVLDTGVVADHPHFAEHATVAKSWDCTKRGAKPKKDGPDGDGHGTHVCGIIGGAMSVADDVGKPERRFAGMAPEVKIHSYKVLDDQGEGRDSWIIKALDHVWETNEEAGRVVIHGVNLSLGGSFDPSVYGCGHTPLAEELRRLWRQGVLVCLAAGNEGYAVLESEDGPIDANMDLSIGDPANLEEAIAVGSIHKTNPHTYGVSYFSSRGPTADGRQKPDVVAPGEKILSARHDFVDEFEPYITEDLYVEMSGTSMATPHVSGLLAAFLSVRREFIGYPDRVKQILVASCTDLKRDPYIQGHGMPNLVRMLLEP